MPVPSRMACFLSASKKPSMPHGIIDIGSKLEGETCYYRWALDPSKLKLGESRDEGWDGCKVG